MIPRGSRLDRASIRSIQHEGQKIETSFFVVYRRPSDTPKVGVIVSGKVSKKAAERNRIRRPAQAAVLNYVKKAHGDMLVVTKRQASRVSRKDLAQDLSKAIEKL